MQHLELEDGDRVVLDVGHSGGVTGLAVTADHVVSGGDDGLVYVRDHAGRSVAPPAHVPAVSALALVPGDDLAVVGTAGRAEAVNLATGRHAPVAGLDDTVVTAASQWGAEVVVGCDDGTLRALTPEGGVRRLAALDEPVHGVVAAGNGVVVATARGTLFGLDGTGTVTWRAPRAAGEVGALAVHGDHVVVGGVGPGRGAGRLLVLAPDGGTLAVQDVPVAVQALAPRGDVLVAALVDGTVRVIEGVGGEAPAPVLGDVLGVVEDVGLEVLVAGPDEELWFGSSSGRVGRLDGSSALPARSSGIVAMSFADDLRSALAVDGRHLLRYDLVGGGVSERAELPGVVAVTHTGDDSDDVVVARPDGRLARLRAPDYDVAATGVAGFAATTLGRHRGLVVAEDDSSYSAVDATTLAPAELPDRELRNVSVSRREGFGFRGRGTVTGLEVSVVGRTGVVVVRPGSVSVNGDGRPWLRVWRGDRWVEPG